MKALLLASMVAVGCRATNQLPSDPAAAVAVSAGVGGACAVTAAGEVKCWNNDSSGAPAKQVTGLTERITGVSAGGRPNGCCGFGCAIAASGGVYCWGDNSYGELGNGSTASGDVPGLVTDLPGGVLAVSAGASSSPSVCAVVPAGNVRCWGLNGGVLGNGTLAGQSSTPVHLTGFSGPVTSVSVGGGFACALIDRGGVECWGTNARGQLGNNSTTSSLAPVPVTGLRGGVASVSAGLASACAVTAAGGVQCWGENNVGQLGNASTTDSSVPVQVVGLASGVTSVSMAANVACVVTASGGVQCWGDNGTGSLGNNTTTNSAVPVQVATLTGGVRAVSVGYGFACAIDLDGSVECWGNSSHVPVHVAGFP